MSRYRVEKIPVSAGRHEWGGYQYSSPSSVAVARRNSLVRTVTDEQILHFHQRKAAGEIFNNPYSSSRVEYACNAAYSNVATRLSGVDKGKTNYARWINCDLESIIGADNCPPVVLSLGNADAQARQECNARINQTDFDLGTFAGEWQKTKKLHRDLGSAFLKLLTPQKQNVIGGGVLKHAVYDYNGVPVLNRHGKPVYRYSKTARRVTGDMAISKVKDMSNAYLITRYGLGPLIADLENAVKYLGRSRALRKTARSMFTVTGSVRSQRDVIDTPGTWKIQYDRVRTVIGRYGILYDTEAFTAGLTGLGVSRPLSTAWELMPWSFVLDWFFRVGLLLDAAQPAFASKTLAAWYSSMEVETLTSQVVGFTAGATGDYSHSPSLTGGSTLITTSRSRSKWDTAMPFVPVFGSGFNNLRCADFAALVLQKFHLRQ